MEDASELELNVGEAGISAVSVKLRGLPFKALEQDISEFFEGFNVQRALLKRYPDGRPNGEVTLPILSVAVSPNIFLQKPLFQRALCACVDLRLDCPTDRMLSLLCLLCSEVRSDLLLQAFVVFGDAEEAQKACLKDREIFCEGDKFGDRYVRVYPTVESDLPDIQECLAAASSAQSLEVVAMRTCITSSSPFESCCIC